MKFADLRLSIGDIMQLQVLESTDVKGERYSTRLIGYLKGRSIITTAPVHDGKVIKMRPGQNVVVRLMANSTVSAFSTHVEATSGSPYSHLHLGYPDQISSNEVRQALRVTVGLVTSVLNISQIPKPDKLSGIILDVSISGARLQVEKVLGKVGDEISLVVQMSLGDIDRILTFPARIRSRLQSDPAGGKKELPVYGIEFLTLPEEDHVYLRAFVYEHIVSGSMH